jgi:ligand-binding sensor domain-containing protein/serine phosphatase RsbU (regulator of sigma subunit)
LAQLDLTQVRFSHLSTKNGLSSDWVLSMVMDKQGFLWIGTHYGLNRYDGYQAKMYRRNVRQANSLGSNRIISLFEDQKGNLWVGTDGAGVYRYDAQHDYFVAYPEVGNVSIRGIGEDQDGNLWVSTDNHPTTKRSLYRYQPTKKGFEPVGQFTTRLGMSGTAPAGPGYVWLAIQREGVAKLDTRTGQVVQRYQHDPANPASIGSDDVKHLLVHQGQLWIATYDNAVSVLDPATGQARHFPAQFDNPLAIAYPQIGGIAADAQGRVWVGTSGAWLYDPATRQAGRLYADPNQPEQLRDPVVTVVYRDPQGRMWVGSQHGGVSVYDPLAFKFAKLGVSYQNPVVHAIGQDQQNRLWVGTETGFVVAELGPNRRFVQLPPQQIGDFGGAVLGVRGSAQGQVWAGTWGNGLLVWDAAARKFNRFTHNPDQPGSLATNHVYGLAHDPARQRLWLATWGGGLAEMDLTNNTFKNHQHNEQDPTSIASDQLLGILNEADYCWLVGNNGLSRFDKRTGKFTRFLHDPANPKSLAAKGANCVYRDRQGTLWVGTQGGLSKMGAEGQFTHYTLADGLPSDAVASIVEDGQGRLWLGTTAGLAQLDPATNKITAYTENDGLLSNQLNNNAAFKDQDGYLFFGSLKGVNWFHPDSLASNPHPPKVYLTELKIFNQPVNVGDYDSLLRQDISLTPAISLSHQQSVFSLDFVALNFTKPEKNQYAYYLDGFEKDWNYVGPKRTATYTNLPPGDYVFRLKASNNDGLWNEQGLALHIHVDPPWWGTWWARLGGLLLLVGSAISYYRYRMAAVQKKNEQLEKAVALRTAELQKTAQDLERTAQDLRSANYLVQEKNEELLSSEEELRQNMEELQANQEVISQQKEHLSQSLAEIHRKNQMILDSIHYAKSIQAAILPNEDQLTAALGPHFVLLWPKDIVSGDFYWLAPRIDHQTEAGQPAHTTLFAVVDCTGHGVPGAFMSLIGHTTLNEIVAQSPQPSPGQVLAELNQRISLALKQTGSSLWQNHDGMDMALCALTRTPEAAWLTFAGARRPLWVARKATGQLEFIRLAGTRGSIAGGNQLNNSQFEEHKLDLLPGDTLYLFTDGLTDQNNPERQKFGNENLQRVLSHSQGLGLPVQKELLASALTDFMAGVPQRDDITLLAVEV